MEDKQLLKSVTFCILQIEDFSYNYLFFFKLSTLETPPYTLWLLRWKVQINLGGYFRMQRPTVAQIQYQCGADVKEILFLLFKSVLLKTITCLAGLVLSLAIPNNGRNSL